MGERAAVWVRVSTREQETANQLLALRQFASGRGFDVVIEYALEESAYNGKHRSKLAEALEDARRGKYTVLLVWALDRLTREGIEATLTTLRQFRERGVRVLSHEESWTDGSPETQELLSAFFGWIAHQESKRRSARTRAGLARRKAQGKPIGRQPGARDKVKGSRKRAGYVARWDRVRARSADATS